MPGSDQSARDMFTDSPNWYIGRAVGIFCALAHLRGEVSTLLSTREPDSNETDVVWDGVPVLDVRSDGRGVCAKRWSGAKSVMPPTGLVGVRVPTDWYVIEASDVSVPAYVRLYAQRSAPLLEKRRAQSGGVEGGALCVQPRQQVAFKLGDFSHGLCVSKRRLPRTTEWGAKRRGSR